MTNADGTPPNQPTPGYQTPPPGYQAAPGYQAPGYQAPGYQVPGQPQAPVGYDTSGQYYQPTPTGPPVRTRKVGDLVVTCILLVLGFFGMLVGVLGAAGLGHSIADAAAQRGVTYQETGAVPVVATLIWVSHVVLFLAAVGGSIPLLVKRRIAFWVPLVAGLVAALIFWGGIFGLILSDSALMQAIQSSQ